MTDLATLLADVGWDGVWLVVAMALLLAIGALLHSVAEDLEDAHQ